MHIETNDLWTRCSGERINSEASEGGDRRFICSRSDRKSVFFLNECKAEMQHVVLFVKHATV